MAKKTLKPQPGNQAKERPDGKIPKTTLNLLLFAALSYAETLVVTSRLNQKQKEAVLAAIAAVRALFA